MNLCLCVFDKDILDTSLNIEWQPAFQSIFNY